MIYEERLDRVRELSEHKRKRDLLALTTPQLEPSAHVLCAAPSLLGCAPWNLKNPAVIAEIQKVVQGEVEVGHARYGQEPISKRLANKRELLGY